MVTAPACGGCQDHKAAGRRYRTFPGEDRPPGPGAHSRSARMP